MENIIISDLFIYPIKSTTGIAINSSNIINTGFEFDRIFGVVNNLNEILTARENSKLLQISCSIKEGELTLLHPQKKPLEINLKKAISTYATEINLFKKNTMGKLIESEEAITWISDILEEPCKLITIDNKNLRKVNYKALGSNISFNDSYPIHLTTTASMRDINNKLETKIIDNRYRPNIVISGTKPYEEENWKSITIGNCLFKVITPTERCTLITINPITLIKDKKQEPLRTLAKNRDNNKKVNFGIYLIPIKTGNIKKGDPICINR